MANLTRNSLSDIICRAATCLSFLSSYDLRSSKLQKKFYRALSKLSEIILLLSSNFLNNQIFSEPWFILPALSDLHRLSVTCRPVSPCPLCQPHNYWSCGKRITVTVSHCQSHHFHDGGFYLKALRIIATLWWQTGLLCLIFLKRKTKMMKAEIFALNYCY